MFGEHIKTTQQTAIRVLNSLIEITNNNNNNNKNNNNSSNIIYMEFSFGCTVSYPHANIVIYISFRLILTLINICVTKTTTPATARAVKSK